MHKTLLTTFAVALAGVAWAEPDLDAAADDVCACLEAPYEQAEQAMAMLQAAQASGDYSALAAAQGDMMGVVSASQTCFEALPAKYPEIDADPALQNQVMAMAEEQCPNPMAGMQPGQ